MKLKKAIARELLIFIVLFGVSYIVYLVIRLSVWAKKAFKKKVPAPETAEGSFAPVPTAQGVFTLAQASEGEV